MAIAKREGDDHPVIVFNLAELGVEERNWRRINTTVRSRSNVLDAYVQRGNRPGVTNGLLMVIPDLRRIPPSKQRAVLKALDQAIAATIEHRASHPERVVKENASTPDRNPATVKRQYSKQ